MTKWYNGITEQEFTDSVNDAVIEALKNGINNHKAKYDDYVRSHLKMWAESGIPAPVNEGNSIQSWMSYLGSHTKDQTLDTMLQRMLLLMDAANEAHDLGHEVEDAIGIYDNRPDLKEKRDEE
jgi:hypothetical protein